MKELVQRYGSPLYVYDAEVIRRQYRNLIHSIAYPRLRIHYACKANSNIHILRILRRLGAGIEVVSRAEAELAMRAGFSDVLYTCSNVTDEELRFAIQHHFMITIDSLGQLERYGKLNPGGSVSVRINNGIGAGMHQHVITGGPESKFGIYHTQVPEILRVAQQHGVHIVGVHQHIGSGILSPHIFMKAMRALLRTAREFPDLEFVDFGGGFGIPYRPGEKPLPMQQLGRQIARTFERFCREYGRRLRLVFEPGRYLVAESGRFLTTVTEVKKTPFHTFVCVDSGFSQFARPFLYGSYHEIVNLSKRNDKQRVTVAGNICESGDVFARDRMLAARAGDVLEIRNAGAYGYAMSSDFNGRARPAEVLVDHGRVRLIRHRHRMVDNP
ncbi:diaminopimelate decarboxylase [Candidatus Woesearchaeota archaeon]|nr:diaminopimelate decarboxylase [Candidatus Woesearchaeota archaeon]